MILGRFEHPASACFDEIDAACAAIDREHGRNRVIAFNVHAFEVPEGAIAFNTEDVMCASQDGSFVVDDPLALWAGHEVWDAFASCAEKYGAKHVPIGYHASMERFARAPEQDIDVFFCGVLNERRKAILDGISARGLTVVHLPRIYGRQRDALLSRAKLSLQVQYNPFGEWNTFRTSHCVANRVPMLSEFHPSTWGFLPSCAYDEIVDRAEAIVRGPASVREAAADHALEEFKKTPMELPS